MLAHRLRHRIEFQEKQETPVDSNGFRVNGGWDTVYLDSDTPLDSVPAEVLTGPGRELIAAGATRSEISARINCRWFPVNEHELAAWRIVWDGRIYNIVSIETDATARREWRFQVKDGGTDGL
ncbi:head-tail adaptor protein [Orrella sp. 11846]|uniref:head-tail adaptor protein n=1 Tax=Orrella sp. 11846 TaxID=3409913 RepID=UPI003B5B8852